MGQVAPDGPGRLLAPFHKGGLQLPPRPGAPELTSPTSLEEAPAAASSGGFHSSQTHLPDTPPVPRATCCDLRVPETELPDPFKVGNFKQGRRVKTAKPQKRENRVLKVGQGRTEVSETQPLKLESACKLPGNLVKCRFCFSCCGVSLQGNRLPGVASPAH